MNEFSLSGGAYVGNTNASKPFATLKADASLLKINIGLLGQLFFNADDIVQIEYASSIAGSGIRIIHNVSSYPKKVIFTTGMPYNEIIENIKATGFFSKTANDQVQYYQVKKMQEQGRIPFKTAAIIAFIIGWNIPFFTSFALRDISRIVSYSRLSILFLFLMTALTLFYPPFQTLVLKEERQINDLKRSLYFILLLTLVSGIMITVISSVAIHK